MSEPNERSERYDRAQSSPERPDDEKYSAIPASAFTLDDTLPPAVPAADHVPSGSRKRDLGIDVVPRAAELRHSGEEERLALWRASWRQAPRPALLALLDLAGAPCSCGGARRDLVPLGDNPEM